jgi:glycosyltransferase involved in cell wall biosynthesis
MQILHVIKATGIAGAERHLLLLLPALRARGVDARLLLLEEAARPQDALSAAMRAQDVPTERRVMRRHLDLSLTPWLVGRLRAERPSLVHAHLSHAQLYAIPSAKLAGIPIITGHHNDDPFVRRFPFRQVYRQIWRMTAGGSAISAAVAAFCREIEGESADRLRIIHYGKNAPDDGIAQNAARSRLRAEIGIGVETVVMGCVGRLTEQKGIPYALEAFARAHAQHPDTTLVILGDGELRTDLEAQAVALGLANAVHFLGWRDDAAAWMNACDIFLFPSLWEGFGLVLLEAMAARLPVVASRVSAIPEVVADGETAILVAPRDVEGFADALARLIADAPLRRHMGLLGRDRLETHFNVGKMTEETIRLYRDVLVETVA